MKRFVLLAVLLAPPFVLAQESPPIAPLPPNPPVVAPVLAAPGSLAVDFATSAFAFAPLRFEGNVEVVSPAQRTDIARIVKDELPRALLRRYPGAHVASPTDTASVTLVPVLVAPASLTPFSSLELRFEVQVPGESGPRVFGERFGLWTLWLAQGNAHLVALDATFKKLP